VRAGYAFALHLLPECGSETRRLRCLHRALRRCCRERALRMHGHDRERKQEFVFQQPEQIEGLSIGNHIKVFLLRLVETFSACLILNHEKPAPHTHLGMNRVETAITAQCRMGVRLKIQPMPTQPPSAGSGAFEKPNRSPDQRIADRFAASLSKARKVSGYFLGTAGSFEDSPAFDPALQPESPGILLGARVPWQWWGRRIGAIWHGARVPRVTRQAQHRRAQTSAAPQGL